MKYEIKYIDGEVAWEGEADSFLGAVEKTFCEEDGPLCVAEAEDIDWSACDLSEVPVVPDIDRAILDAIRRPGNRLNMGCWHGDDCYTPDGNSCETTHCRAGWAIHLAGEAGYALERRLGGHAAIAGTLIYAASRPGKPVPNFHCRHSVAMADLMACAGETTGD